ncbi:MAG: hypothetical protein KC912_24855 [Proteobacteria bacterium]|nr:hypothetical protein [Pseudomonadota bacterium]
MANNNDAPGGLAGAPAPPPGPTPAPDALIESYVRTSMHSDRSPGTVVAVCHPLRMYKVPRGLFEALKEHGHTVAVVETLPDRRESIAGIRDALLEASKHEGPLDVLVVSGDGSLDHHVLVAAFWAFYPELVQPLEGCITVEPPSPEERGRIDPSLRAYCEPLPEAGHLEPTEENIHRLWVMRRKIERAVRRGARPEAIARKAGAYERDPTLRLAVYATLFPHRVVLRAHGFDLGGLADATQEQAFQGLYSHIRSIAVYPAGTAADNALYAGIPGYAYAQSVKLLDRLRLTSLKEWWEARTLQRFLDTFHQAVIVPGRFSVVAFDGDWTVLSSHAAGGPGGGSFFAPDLEAKTGGLLGYLARIPSMILFEGFLGSTVIRITARDQSGAPRLQTRSRLVEALYTNRAFIAGVGSVPSTNPTGFAGQSSLVVGPPVLYRDDTGSLVFDLSGLLTFGEAIVKGILGRVMHAIGLGVGDMAGGGRFWFASPENQITLQEGEGCDLEFYGPEGHPRAVSTQVSGDPYQAYKMQVRVAWGPLPLLASPGSLLLAAAQRSLARLRQAQGWQLRRVFIGGLAWFRHRLGAEWSQSLLAETGLFLPPRTLPRRLTPAHTRLLAAWNRRGAGPFVDTTEQGLALGRRGRYAHNSDHTAHLMVLRERGTLLVRQVRRTDRAVYEIRTNYRRWWGGWVIHDSQTRRWDADQDPVIIQEEHYFRDAQAFRRDAPSFFPFIDSGLTLREITQEVDRLDDLD